MIADERSHRRVLASWRTRAWGIVGALSVTETVSWGILYYAFAVFLLPMQQELGYSATDTGLRLLPLTLALFAVAPISGRLIGRIGLRAPLVTGLALIAVGLLLMRGLTTTSSWTHLLPGFVVGGLAIGIISPALAAAMVGAVFTDRLGGGLPGLVDGLNAVFTVAGAGGAIWPLLAGFRVQPSQAASSSSASGST